jgi:hypothetical protein
VAFGKLFFVERVAHSCYPPLLACSAGLLRRGISEHAPTNVASGILSAAGNLAPRLTLGAHLEQQGHTVEWPVVTGHERFYHVDGMPRTDDQIIKWVVDGVRPADWKTCAIRSQRPGGRTRME